MKLKPASGRLIRHPARKRTGSVLQLSGPHVTQHLSVKYRQQIVVVH